jgi:hypothetical protein
MGLEQAKVREIVEKAVTHRWGVPEFQRGFVWTPQKVKDLMESLWRGYPVGSFLIWYAPDEVEPRVAGDTQEPDAWVVDGQQRTSALCLLLGRKPYWWSERWDEALARNDVRFNVLAEEDPFFSLRTAAMRGDAGRAWVPVRDVLAADDERLSELVHRLLGSLDLPMAKFGTLYSRLDRVRKVRDVDIPILTVSMDIEDVTEIFARLNSAGTKVTEADIALALAASRNPGWARQRFLPFVAELDEAGFDLDPNLVFRSMVAIGLGRTRLKDVPRRWWVSGEMESAWGRSRGAWRKAINYVEQRGVLSAEVLPTKNALIPLAVLIDRFPDAVSDDRAFGWLLHVTRTGRYGGSALTALDADVRVIGGAGDLTGALDGLRQHAGPWGPFTADDFLRDYRDRVLRLVLYLVMYDRGARDWISRERLGFQGVELLESFNPQWHHIYPRAYLRAHGVPEERWDVFANIAVLGPSTNIRFGAQDPMAYLERYGVSDDLLAEQLIPGRHQLTLDRYEDFLKERAVALAEAANRYVSRLWGEIP